MMTHSRLLLYTKPSSLYGMQVRKRKITKLDAYVYARIALMHLFRALTYAEA